MIGIVSFSSRHCAMGLQRRSIIDMKLIPAQSFLLFTILGSDAASLSSFRPDLISEYFRPCADRGLFLLAFHQ
jgi:hypothetical protein